MSELVAFPRERFLQVTVDRYVDSSRNKQTALKDLFNKINSFIETQENVVTGAFEYQYRRNERAFEFKHLEEELNAPCSIEYIRHRGELVASFNSALYAYVSWIKQKTKFGAELENYFGSANEKPAMGWIQIRINNGDKIYVSDLEKKFGGSNG